MYTRESDLLVLVHKAHAQNHRYKSLPHVEAAASVREQLSNRPRLSLKNQLVDYP